MKTSLVIKFKPKVDQPKNKSINCIFEMPSNKTKAGGEEVEGSRLRFLKILLNHLLVKVTIAQEKL
jgi:hypothetical protein